MEENLLEAKKDWGRSLPSNRTQIVWVQPDLLRSSLDLSLLKAQNDLVNNETYDHGASGIRLEDVCFLAEL